MRGNPSAGSCTCEGRTKAAIEQKGKFFFNYMKVKMDLLLILTVRNYGQFFFAVDKLRAAARISQISDVFLSDICPLKGAGAPRGEQGSKVVPRYTHFLKQR